MIKYLLPLLLSGCAIFDNPGAFEAVDKPAMVIDAKVVNSLELERICGVRGPIVGCARVTRTHCTIYTLKYTTEEIFGHELRHCFYGAFHD